MAQEELKNDYLRRKALANRLEKIYIYIYIYIKNYSKLYGSVAFGILWSRKERALSSPKYAVHVWTEKQGRT